MKILITGGTGYLGGRIAQFMVDQGDIQLVIGSRKKDRQLPWLPNIPVVETIWDSPKSLRKACEGVDAIIHLAGMNAKDSVIDPDGAFELAIFGTRTLVNQAISVGVKRILFFSTAHVYRNLLTGIITENTLAESSHPYATSHLAGEKIVLNAHERGEIEGIIIRLSNSFGAPSHKDIDCWMLLFNDLCLSAVTERKMKLHSSGLQRRDFITLTDVCRATLHLLKLNVDNYKKTIFNLGGEWAPTILEVTRLVSEKCTDLFGFTPILTSLTPQPGELSETLEYKIDLLKHSGFRLNSDIDAEIKQLLVFCERFK